MARRLTLGTLERIIASHVNLLRADIGLPPVATIDDVYLAASVVIAYTAEPFEYPRSDRPAKVRLVSPGPWEPPADPPAWLDELAQPLVLVTCSMLYQDDRRLAKVAYEAFAGRRRRSGRSGRARRARSGAGERARREDVGGPSAKPMVNAARAGR